MFSLFVEDLSPSFFWGGRPPSTPPLLRGETPLDPPPDALFFKSFIISVIYSNYLINFKTWDKKEIICCTLLKNLKIVKKIPTWFLILNTRIFFPIWYVKFKYRNNFVLWNWRNKCCTLEWLDFQWFSNFKCATYTFCLNII